MNKAVKTNLIFFFFITISSFPLKGNNNTYAYIEQYKTIVINEMNRTGIPASIKMAQAILESTSGRSTLARQSNNHFGIKCGKGWTGEEVYRHDDDYKDGLLVRSCFRAYDNPEESFMAHSDFLANPYSKRYKFLFDLDMYDYKSWSKGLREAGYATDPNYSKKLIDLIEKYQLYNLDYDIVVEPIELAMEDGQQDSRESKGTPKGETKSPIIIKAPTGAPKSKYSLNKGYYTYQMGDNMNDIASHYNLDLKELYFKNRLPFGALPKPGEKLAIRKYIHFGNTPDYFKSPAISQEDYLFEEEITISSL